MQDYHNNVALTPTIRLGLHDRVGVYIINLHHTMFLTRMFVHALLGCSFQK